MYTISKGPSKIVQKTRRGLTQHWDSLETLQEIAALSAAAAATTGKKSPTGFQGAGGGGQNPGTNGNNSVLPAAAATTKSNSTQYPIFTVGQFSKKERYYHRNSQEKVSPQQEEIVKYVNAKWSTVQKEIESSKANGKSSVTYYQEMEPNPSLRNFEPFDLESWWGRKLYRNLTQGGL